ncbi:MAG: type II toxin-antitoxin system VapC family toxin [Chloroflexota bacterium]
MGLTVLDAGVIIGVLDATDAHHVTARDALAAAVERGDTLVVPASAYAECLVGPALRGESAVQRVNDFLFDLTAEVEPITRQVAAQAAQLRARHGSRLRLPDALVVALAMHLKADRLLTTDRGWPRVGVRVDLVGS